MRAPFSIHDEKTTSHWSVVQRVNQEKQNKFQTWKANEQYKKRWCLCLQKHCCDGYKSLEQYTVVKPLFLRLLSIGKTLWIIFQITKVLIWQITIDRIFFPQPTCWLWVKFALYASLKKSSPETPVSQTIWFLYGARGIIQTLILLMGIG